MDFGDDDDEKQRNSNYCLIFKVIKTALDASILNNLSTEKITKRYRIINIFC